MKQLKRYIIPIGLCIILDQLVKIIIYYNFYHLDIDIIGRNVRFSPVINIHLSWAGNYFAVLRHLEIVLIVNLIAIILFIVGFSFYNFKNPIPSAIAKIIYVVGISGCFCSLIDKVIWKGSLDFIQIPRFFTFDIKDVYISIFEILFIIQTIRYRNEMSTRELLRWCFFARKDNS